MNVDRFLTWSLASQRGDDIFGIEFQNGWEARDAREAAELAADHDRPSLAQRALARGLAAVQRASAARVRRHDDVVAGGLRSSRSAAK